MNVGVDGSGLLQPRAGVGNYIQALLDPLIRENNTSSFFVYASAPIDIDTYPNVTLRFPARPGKGPIWQNIQLPLLMRRDRLDVFWGGNGFLPMVGAAGIGTVVTIHDLVYRFAAESLPLVSRWNRRVFQPLSAKGADKIVAVSEATAKDVERIYGQRVNAVIHPIVSSRFRIVDRQEVERVRKKFALDNPYLLVLGTLEPRKNLATLIRAYDESIQSGLRLPELVIVGRKGWQEGLTRRIRLAEERGIIRVLGFVENPDLPGLYSAAKAFIYPSLYEGFGMPLLEAQLCGTPVLYGTHPSVREAAGDVGVQFTPTVEGIKEVFSRINTEDCPLACRLPALISNSARNSASILWDLLQSARDSAQGGRVA